MSHEMRFDESASLSGYRLLIVEDDYYVAEDLSRTLRCLGATVVGPTPALASARSLMRALRPDCVLLNVTLGRENTIEFALELRALGAPVIFVTGYDVDGIPKTAAEIPLLRKPVSTPALIQNIRAQTSCYEKH
jgi:DNA-binding response OmpR family regulator